MQSPSIEGLFLYKGVSPLAKPKIDSNQYTYLSNLAKSTDPAQQGNAQWAKAQLAESDYTPTPYKSQYADTTDTDPNKKLETYKTDKTAAGNELLRAKMVYEDEKKNGATADRLSQISGWANQVRGSSGISNDDALYGNSNKVNDIEQLANVKKALANVESPKPPVVVNNVGDGSNNGGGSNNTNGNGNNSGNYTPTGPTNVDYINSMYDKSQNAQMVRLRQARDVALQQLNKIQTGAEQSAYDNRNSADSSYYRNANALKELMANNGTFQSGEMNSNFANLLAGNQGELGKINRDLANTTTDVNERRGLINNNAMDSEQALMDTIESARMGALLNDTYKGQDRQLQIAQLMGMLNGQKTLGGRAQDFSEMDSNRRYDRGIYESDRNFGRGVVESDRNYEYNKTRDAIKDAQYQQTFDENVRQSGLDYAIKKAQSDNQISVNNQQVQMSKDKLAWDKDPNNPSNRQTTTTKAPTRAEQESDYIMGFDSLTPENRIIALNEDKANIIADLGIAGYERLLSKYGGK
jgi:hypothetical protein